MTKRQLQQRIKARKKKLLVAQITGTIPQIDVTKLSQSFPALIVQNPYTRLKLIFMGVTLVCTIVHIFSTIYISILGATYAKNDTERQLLVDESKFMTSQLHEKESLTIMLNDAPKYGYAASGKKIILKPEAGIASR